MNLKKLGTVIITFGVLSITAATYAQAAGGMGGHGGMGHAGMGMGGGFIGGPPPAMGGIDSGLRVNHELNGLRVNHDLGVRRTEPVNGPLPGETTRGCTAAQQAVSGC